MRKQRIWITRGFDKAGKLVRLEENISLKNLKRAIEQTVKSKYKLEVSERVVKPEKART